MPNFYDGPSEAPSILGSAGHMQRNKDSAVNQIQAGQMPPMARAAERHAKALTRLEDRLEALFARLQPLCRASTPTPTNGNKAPKDLSNQSPFAEALHQISDKVDALTFRTEDVLNRLEV